MPVLIANDDSFIVSEDQPGYLQSLQIITLTGPGTDDVILIDPSNELINPVELDVLANDFTDQEAIYITSVDTNQTIGDARLYPNSHSIHFPKDGPVLYSPLGQFEYLAAGETATDTFTYTVTNNPGTIVLSLGAPVAEPLTPPEPPTPLFDTATVTITIQGENDAPTDIKVGNLSIAENMAGVVIGNVAVDDVDISDTHAITVNDARFEVLAGQLKLKDGVSLDFESEDYVGIQITATDPGGLSFAKHFTIAVQNIDDDDVIIGNSADNKLAGGIGNDIINGRAGNDQLNGNRGDDSISGGVGFDVLRGGLGNDSLNGGLGNDQLFGGLGADHLDGGLGRDIMFGGAGADIFYFDNLNDSLSASRDIIGDFQRGLDLIDLSGLNGGEITNFSDLDITDNGTNTLISANHPTTDFEILLGGVHNLDANDFVF